MRTSPLTVLCLLVAGLMLMGIASMVILRAQAQQDRLRLRITHTVGLYQRRGVGNTTPATSGVGLPALAQGLGPMLAKFFGFDPMLRDHYVVRWWIVLVVTLVIACVGAKLGKGLGGNLVWLGIPVGWVVLSRKFFSWCESRRRDKLFKQFPDALAMIVRAVRVGIPVSDSIRAVGQDMEAPTGQEFTRLSRELSIGMALPEGLKAMAERNGLQEYRFFATALSLQNQTGGGLSETLENLADVIRKRVATRQKGHALAAEAKMSSLVLAMLPPFAGLGLWIMNSKYIVLLFTESLGQKILGAAILLLTLGIVSMNVLIRKSLS